MEILPTSGQEFRFDWISLIFLVILLFAIIRGIRKGFIYSLLQFAGLLIVFFLAYLLAKPIGNWLYQTNGWGESVQTSFINFLKQKGADNPVKTGNDLYDLAIKTSYGSDNVMEWVVSGNDLNTTVPGSSLTVLETALNSSGVPSFLRGFVSNFVLSAVPETGATECLAFYLAASLSSLVFISIGFAFVFVVGYLVLIVFRVLAKKLNHVKVIGPLNRLLGGVFGIAIAFVDISLFSAILVSLSGISEFYSFLDGVLFLSDDSIYTIGKMFYNNNFLELLMGYYNGVVTAIMGSI